jgi:hypothetical protein
MTRIEAALNLPMASYDPATFKVRIYAQTIWPSQWWAVTGRVKGGGKRHAEIYGWPDDKADAEDWATTLAVEAALS